MFPFLPPPAPPFPEFPSSGPLCSSLVLPAATFLMLRALPPLQSCCLLQSHLTPWTAPPAVSLTPLLNTSRNPDTLSSLLTQETSWPSCVANAGNQMSPSSFPPIPGHSAGSAGFVFLQRVFLTPDFPSHFHHPRPGLLTSLCFSVRPRGSWGAHLQASPIHPECHHRCSPFI